MPKVGARVQPETDALIDKAAKLAPGGASQIIREAIEAGLPEVLDRLRRSRPDTSPGPEDSTGAPTSSAPPAAPGSPLRLARRSRFDPTKGRVAA